MVRKDEGSYLLPYKGRELLCWIRGGYADIDPYRQALIVDEVISVVIEYRRRERLLKLTKDDKDKIADMIESDYERRRSGCI